MLPSDGRNQKYAASCFTSSRYPSSLPLPCPPIPPPPPPPIHASMRPSIHPSIPLSSTCSCSSSSSSSSLPPSPSSLLLRPSFPPPSRPACRAKPDLRACAGPPCPARWHRAPPEKASSGRWNSEPSSA
eukprot:7332732-Pyramimonas_sp.AAC.2